MNRIAFARASIVPLTRGACAREKGPERKPAFPAKGTVFVDGKPVGGLAIEVGPINGYDKERPTVPSRSWSTTRRWISDGSISRPQNDVWTFGDAPFPSASPNSHSRLPIGSS
jgi:hypothetical protein